MKRPRLTGDEGQAVISAPERQQHINHGRARTAGV